MSEHISFEEFSLLLAETFDRGQELIFTPSGSSMLPMLDGVNDKVTFSPKPDRLKKYDVAFYRRAESGHLVLHRLIGFTDDGGYIFSGDNQCSYEYGITDDDVLALMTSFTHKGKQRSVTGLRYRIYCRWIVFKKTPRRFIRLVKKLCKKLTRS